MMKRSLMLGMSIGLVLTSCSTLVNFAKPQQKTINIDLICDARPDSRYSDLSRGIEILVSSDITNDQILDLSQITPKKIKAIGKSTTYEFSPTIKEFVSQSLGTYLRSAGFAIGRDRENDYRLKVRVTEFKLVESDSQRGTVILNYDLISPDNKTILQQTARGRYTSSADLSYSELINRAYSRALSEMDLDGIASALKVNKRADQEPNKQVNGDGNSALEHTIIRWYIVSSPAGADVSWRVVSSTPDVKNTNSNYVGTTPYETTESFDIRGLNWENSGNVQIEVTCERAGYIPQKRRFNLRQAIEQKEISAKFNLVKDE